MKLLHNSTAMRLLSQVVILASWITVDSASANEPTHNFVGQRAETNRVNESGNGYSKSKIDCISSPEDRVFNQSSFKTNSKSSRNANLKQCSLSFEGYSEVAPNIFQPTKACLINYVKVKGGILNIGSNAKQRCEMSYQLQTPLAIGAAPVNPNGRNSMSVMPLVPADIRMSREHSSTITISVPLATINGRIEPISDTGYSLKNIGFTDFTSNARSLTIKANASIFPDISCKPEIKLAIPPSKFSDLGVQVLNVSPGCESGGLISNLADLPATISKLVHKAAKSSIILKIFEGSDFEGWAADDPELAKFLNSALAQGRYCEWRGMPGLCIDISWADRSAIELRESSLLENVPQPEGILNVADTQKRLEEAYKFSLNHQMYVQDNFSFPAGFRKGKVEDADMAIFGGLLCRAGIQEGCNLVSNSRDSNGRFFRSPRRVGDADLPEKATFSGDQLKGVIHYFTGTANREHLTDFLLYLRGHKTFVPSNSVRLESGYSSCPNRAPNFTCLLIGYDWFVLRRLAEYQGLSWALPKDIDLIQRIYDFDFEDLVWESLITNNGYRIHLIANMAWQLQTLGISDPRISKVIKIIAAREPDNPFFNYLLLGPDQRVKRLADEQCSFDESRSKRHDWAWQRAVKDEAWKESMGWDCVFIYKLLIDDPTPKNLIE